MRLHSKSIGGYCYPLEMGNFSDSVSDQVSVEATKQTLHQTKADYAYAHKASSVP